MMIREGPRGDPPCLMSTRVICSPGARVSTCEKLFSNSVVGGDYMQRSQIRVVPWSCFSTRILFVHRSSVGLAVCAQVIAEKSADAPGDWATVKLTVGVTRDKLRTLVMQFYADSRVSA